MNSSQQIFEGKPFPKENRNSFVKQYDLTDKNDSILTTELKRFNFSDPPIDPIKFAMDLAEHMLHYDGVGLAANQLGLPYRVFAIKADPILVCYNPIIVDQSEESILLEEGCLTFPNFYVKVKRPLVIKARYTKPNGETLTTKFDGVTSRIFQHELDHLNGILFQNRATKYHLEVAKNQYRKRSKKRDVH